MLAGISHGNPNLMLRSQKGAVGRFDPCLFMYFFCQGIKLVPGHAFSHLESILLQEGFIINQTGSVHTHAESVIGPGRLTALKKRFRNFRDIDHSVLHIGIHILVKPFFHIPVQFFIVLL